MVVLHYILVGPVYYSGSGSFEKVFWVAFVEQEVMVAVEQAVEAKEQEESCIGAPPLMSCIPLRL